MVKKIDRNKNSGIFHPGLLTAVRESRILDLYSFDFTKGDDEL